MLIRFPRSVECVLVAALLGMGAPRTTEAQVEILSPDELSSIAQYGASIAVKDDVAVIGAPFDGAAGPASGVVYVHRRTAGEWIVETVLAPTSQPSAFFGTAVAFDGTTLFAAANGPGDGGVYVFRRAVVAGDPQWTLQARLAAPAGVESYGHCVTVDGDLAAIGTREIVGRLFTYRCQNDVWVPDQVLQPLDLDPGDAFGSAVSLAGDTLAVGAPRSHINVGKGRVFIYRRVDDAWVEEARPQPDSPPEHSGFGYALSLHGDRCAVGAYESEDSGALPGDAYVFRRVGTEWSQEAHLIAPDEEPPAAYGQSLALHGGHVVVGAFKESSDSVDVPSFAAVATGTAYVFRRIGPLWVPAAVWGPGPPAHQDHFGRSVAASADAILVGAPRKNSHGEVLVFDPPLLPPGWFDLGGASLGTGGVTPRLLGTGGQEPAVVELHIRHALPHAPTFFVLGTSLTMLEYLGGILVPTPDVVVGGVQLDDEGRLSLSVRWPDGFPSGSLVGVQAWVVDDAAASGVAASNGLALVAP